MAISFSEFIRRLLPLRGEAAAHYAVLQQHLEPDEEKTVKAMLKLKRAGISFSKMEVSKEVGEDASYPQLDPAVMDKEVKSVCDRINRRVLAAEEKTATRHIGKRGWDLAPLIAPNLVGFDMIKKAVLLQLISDEPLHILLLGDPGVGKTDILHDAAEVSPISSFGLGSGTSGVGLSAMFKGDKLIKGLLPQADNGLCCIDELNLMKEQDMAGLYNAMEKGFVSYDKAGKSVRLDARISVLATANPKGDRFAGHTVETLHKQLPFDPALLSRFHLVFLVRRPGIDEFKKISAQIATGKKRVLKKKDKELLKRWINEIKSKEVVFPAKLKDSVAELAEDIKRHEDKYLIEVSPRLIIGVIRLAKAVARLEGKKKVDEDALSMAEEILLGSLSIG
ncbi:MAG: hypothetical protein ABIC95_04935 [archaeon]